MNTPLITTLAALLLSVAVSAAAEVSPTVRMTTPANGATLSGNVYLTSSASDPDATPVASVTYYLDATNNLGSATAPPCYPVRLATTNFANGTHTISAKALDTIGNQGVSSNVTVTVNNLAIGQVTWRFNPGASTTINANAVKTDLANNVIVVGQFIGTVNLGGVVVSNTTPGTWAGFVAKYNSSGTLLWGKSLGSAGVMATAVAIDNQTNIVVAGQFTPPSINLGGGTITNNAPGGGFQDCFVAKFSSAGTHLWSLGFGAVSSDGISGVGIDTNRDVYVAAQCAGTVNFGTNSLGNRITLTGAGGYDLALVKFSGVTGATTWAKLYGSSGNEAAYGLTVDRSGNVLVTGNFAGGSLGGAVLPAGYFVAKYLGSDGSYQWAQAPTGGIGYAITTDPVSGTVFATGQSPSSSVAFLAAYNLANGAVLWNTTYSGCVGSALAVDGSGSLALTGRVMGQANFGFGWLYGNPGYFLAMFTATASTSPVCRWAKGAVGIGSYSWGSGVAFDTLRHVLTAGVIEGTADLGGGATITGPLSNGSEFVAQYYR